MRDRAAHTMVPALCAPEKETHMNSILSQRTASMQNAVLAAAVAIAVASPACAMASGTVTTASTPAAGVAQRRAERDYRASHILGMEVFDPAGVDFGRFRDIVVNMSNGAVRYAIISLNGEAALDETHYYAIPASAFTLQGDHLLMKVSGTAWREHGAPQQRWPALRDSGYWSEVDRLSGIPAVQPTDAYFAHRVSQLIGKPVHDVEGKPLGVLRDIVVDMNAGTVRYAALAADSGLAQPGELYRFPLTSFMFREDGQGNLQIARPLVLDVEPTTLVSMQGFPADRWPGADEPGYAPVLSSSTAANSGR
jgi:sporulation protein YlmC with PRC-barrel domain